MKYRQDIISFFKEEYIPAVLRAKSHYQQYLPASQQFRKEEKRMLGTMVLGTTEPPLLYLDPSDLHPAMFQRPRAVGLNLDWIYAKLISQPLYFSRTQIPSFSNLFVIYLDFSCVKKYQIVKCRLLSHVPSNQSIYHTRLLFSDILFYSLLYCNSLLKHVIYSLWNNTLKNNEHV